MPTGTITTDGTEQEIFTGEPADAVGEIEGSLDLNEMTVDEEVTVRLYKAVDGNTYRVADFREFGGVQENPVVTIGFIGGHPDEAPLRLTVELTAGSNITIPYEYQRKY